MLLSFFQNLKISVGTCFFPFQWFHLPTERPSFCNWYGKYHRDTYKPHEGRLHLCWTPVFQCWAATHGGWTQYTCFGHPAVGLRKFGGTCARGLEHWASRIEMSVTKNVLFQESDSRFFAKIKGLCKDNPVATCLCTICNVEGQAVWSTRPNFWTCKETPQKFARFRISSNFGGHWNL